MPPFTRSQRSTLFASVDKYHLTTTTTKLGKVKAIHILKPNMYEKQSFMRISRQTCTTNLIRAMVAAFEKQTPLKVVVHDSVTNTTFNKGFFNVTEMTSKHFHLFDEKATKSRKGKNARLSNSTVNPDVSVLSKVVEDETVFGLSTTSLATNTTATTNHTTATTNHTTATTNNTTATTNHTTATTTAAVNHTATTTNTTALTNHTTASTNHTTASTNHTTASTNHTTASTNNTTADVNHTTATTTNTTTAVNHTTATTNHTDTTNAPASVVPVVLAPRVVDDALVHTTSTPVDDTTINASTTVARPGAKAIFAFTKVFPSTGVKPVQAASTFPHAIKTNYKGITFRSRLESRFATLMDELHIRYIYEPMKYNLIDGGTYMIDFFLPDQQLYVELKPKWPHIEEESKCEQMSARGFRVALLYGSSLHKPPFRSEFYKGKSHRDYSHHDALRGMTWINGRKLPGETVFVYGNHASFTTPLDVQTPNRVHLNHLESTADMRWSHPLILQALHKISSITYY